jgi:hypothetical protein
VLAVINDYPARIYCILQNAKFLCRVRKSPPLLPILNHMYPVHNQTPCFFTINFNLLVSIHYIVAIPAIKMGVLWTQESFYKKLSY